MQETILRSGHTRANAKELTKGAVRGPLPHMSELFNSGALLDTRPETEKQKDYKFEELVITVNPVNWVEKPKSAWRKFPIFNQDGSGSCVAQTLAKLLGILYFLKEKVYVHFSATHIYQRRYNKPSGGMAGVDAFKIGQQGVTLESLVPSQGMNDAQMDNTVIEKYKQDVGSVFKIPNYVILPIKDIDTIASVIQTTGKGVMTWFYFKHDEWTEIPTILHPNLKAEDNDASRHSVAVVDFTLYQGKKALIIEDSWGPNFGMGGQRVITEDFFKVRNFFAAYPINFIFADQTTQKPKYTFTITTKLGSTGPDVKAFQEVLRYEGLYPTNVEITGYFGSVTKNGALQWQKKYGLVADGIIGPNTRKKLNEIYS